MSVLSSTNSPDPDDNTDLLHLLTEDWNKENGDIIKNSKWTKDYLTRLKSLTLEELKNEPFTIRETQQQIQSDAQQLAYEDYPSFLHAQTCRRELDTTLNGLDNHFTGMLSSVPALQAACEQFTMEAKTIMQERSKITRVLEHQHSLVDLLELPQLMDTCVWNGYYTEAMDLASHVRLLYTRYPLSIVGTIHDQVQTSSDLMLVQLISHLRRPIKLAAAMNVIGYLRRMDIFTSETELRLAFLRCRHDFVEQKLEKIKKPSLSSSTTTTDDHHVPFSTKNNINKNNNQSTIAAVSPSPSTSSQETFDYLKKYLDIMREQMFEIATQYMSVFSSKENDTLLSNYMIQLITLIQHTLTNHLVDIQDTSALASLLTQLQYCGMSLGRVGLDFRQLCVSIFEDAMQPLILKMIDQATSTLVNGTLKIYIEENTIPSTWLNTNSITNNTNNNNNNSEPIRNDSMSNSPSSSPTSSTNSPSLSITNNEDATEMITNNNNSNNNKITSPQNPYQPPLLLVEYPCIAIFTNGILTTLNALRLLPAIGLYHTVKNHLDACLLEIANAIKQYTDQSIQQYPDEAIYLDSFSSTFTRCCVPFLSRCLIEGIYGYSMEDNDTVIKDIEALLSP
ncbi:Dor1-like family-domain-containing protein [Cunninghamella echinulata]|nr:Dor1-like family-domain-containing protein [Cunninghamella echinulata]